MTSRAMMKVLGVTIASLAFTLTACGGSSSPTTPRASGELDDIDSAQQVWRDAKLQSYAFTVTSSCGERAGIGTYAVTVDPDGSHVQPDDPTSGPTAVRSIDDLFAQIQQAIDLHADRLDVSYDQSLGFPKQIDVDYHLNGIDDEECYRVSGFSSS
jgi:hypothetical protein